MSNQKRSRYLCRICREPASFTVRGSSKLRGDRQHTLCRRCFRKVETRWYRAAVRAIREWVHPNERKAES